jgi:hypothetical protein
MHSVLAGRVGYVNGIKHLDCEPGPVPVQPACSHGLELYHSVLATQLKSRRLRG